MIRKHLRVPPVWLAGLSLISSGVWTGCATSASPGVSEMALKDALAQYAARQANPSAAPATDLAPADDGLLDFRGANAASNQARPRGAARATDYPTFGTFAGAPETSQSQPASAATGPKARGAPPGYWRQDVWHQMGNEALQLGKRDFWRGYKTSFWNLENALVLTATMGASIAIRETGVDDTVANRIRGHRQLGDMDETLQIMGNPGTHFAAAGVLWLGTALTQDMENHEFAKSLTQALAVTGATTLILKVACNTSSPDDERYAWPSGHTSSSFAFAAVVNEYYGPWVGVPAIALAGLVGYQRLDSRVHDFSDVVFGGVLGYVVGTSIARDNKAQFPELFGMQLIPFTDPQTGASGLALLKRFK